MESPFDAHYTHKVTILYADGRMQGPVLCCFVGNKLSIPDENLSLTTRDRLFRTMPNGKEDEYEIEDAVFEEGFGEIPTSWELTVRRTASRPREQARTTNISINNSQGFQIGDHNRQEIAPGLEKLIEAIAKSDAAPEEKEAAKSRVAELLRHPLVGAIVGVAGTAILRKYWAP
ncbi:MAG: hypothetical protein ACAI34_22605 [Verrucomicrobium sp.]